MGHSGNGLGAAGPVPIAARSRSPAKTSAPTASPRSDRTSPVAAARASSVAAQTDAPYEPQVLGAESDSVTPSRARRVLEFARRHPRENEDIRGDAEEDRRERLDASARALSDALAGSDGSASSPARASRASAQTSSASTSGATTPATPSPRPSRAAAPRATRGDARRGRRSRSISPPRSTSPSAPRCSTSTTRLSARPPRRPPPRRRRRRRATATFSQRRTTRRAWRGFGTERVRPGFGIQRARGFPPRPGARRGAPINRLIGVGGDADRESVSPSKPSASRPGPRRVAATKKKKSPRSSLRSRRSPRRSPTAPR